MGRILYLESRPNLIFHPPFAGEKKAFVSSGNRVTERVERRELGPDELTVSGWFAEEGAMVTLDVRLGYRDDTISEWTELAHSFEQRKLHCNLNISKVPDIRLQTVSTPSLFVSFSGLIGCLAVLLADHGQRGSLLRL